MYVLQNCCHCMKIGEVVLASTTRDLAANSAERGWEETVAWSHLYEFLQEARRDHSALAQLLHIIQARECWPRIPALSPSRLGELQRLSERHPVLMQRGEIHTRLVNTIQWLITLTVNLHFSARLNLCSINFHASALKNPPLSEMCWLDFQRN